MTISHLKSIRLSSGFFIIVNIRLSPGISFYIVSISLLIFISHPFVYTIFLFNFLKIFFFSYWHLYIIALRSLLSQISEFTESQFLCSFFFLLKQKFYISKVYNIMWNEIHSEVIPTVKRINISIFVQNHFLLTAFSPGSFYVIFRRELV